MTSANVDLAVPIYSPSHYILSFPWQCRLPMTEQDMKTGKVPTEAPCRPPGAPCRPIRGAMQVIRGAMEVIRVTMQDMLEEDFIKSNPAWHAELELMMKMKVKAEIREFG